MPFDFDAAVSAPFRMQPGLRRMGVGAQHLTPAAPGSPHQREKLAVFSTFANQALLCREGFDAVPALHALAAHAATEHPQVMQWQAGRAVGLQLGAAVGPHGEVEETGAGLFGLGDEVARCLRGLPAPWRLAALLSLAFIEDFAIVDASDGSVPWLAVALPSHWAPEEKVGRHFTAVHAPVADNTLLLKAAESLMGLVTRPEPGVRWERFVWTLTDHPRLHAHPQRLAHPRWAGTPVERAWFRSERQTFIALPAQGDEPEPEREQGHRHGQAIFTIAVGLEPLAEVVATPGRAAALRAALASMSEAVLAYRGLSEVRGPLLAWLAGRA